ncbi:3-phosphoglycerate dehydrogenase [candidate division WOR-3 bacterium]|uniref:3-phosphoglycerate dehydrogenase n=1 Tax=candidate division WOR-3 bacterium TaxID=2052148 RepID=A0A9D5K7W9_UNCW3|nr:3-phosphoglycerate dehydrogenase [candidate division WOR-3 bacterium]MBD3363953.1 3-phosphoglycerate dehydrogenase [candidate division WOR-3 bacterium]
MKVLVNDPIAEDGVKKLKDAGFEVVVNHLEPDDLKVQIGQYDGLIVRSATKVRREIIEAADNLKVIGRAGVGLDNVDRDAAKEKGIEVRNTPAATSISVAELALGMMLAAARHIGQGTVSLKQGRWDKKKFKGIELFGKTLGIVGMGRIGTELAKRAKALGMDVIFNDAVIEASEYAEFKSLDDVLAHSDFVSLHLPHTDSTHYIINSDTLAKMKDGAILINAARGGVVDEEALYQALKSGKLRAAAVDVYETEPTTEHKLFELENVVLTPHVGAQAAEGQLRAGIQVAEEVIKVLKG